MFSECFHEQPYESCLFSHTVMKNSSINSLLTVHCMCTARFPPLSPPVLPVVFSAVEASQNPRFQGKGVFSAALYEGIQINARLKSICHWVAINHFGVLVFYEINLLEVS